MIDVERRKRKRKMQRERGREQSGKGGPNTRPETHKSHPAYLAQERPEIRSEPQETNDEKSKKKGRRKEKKIPKKY
jgi:hypothetical protein